MGELWEGRKENRDGGKVGKGEGERKLVFKGNSMLLNKHTIQVILIERVVAPVFVML